jgi:hypothetical protein
MQVLLNQQFGSGPKGGTLGAQRAPQQEPHRNRQAPAQPAKEKDLIPVGQYPDLTGAFPKRIHRCRDCRSRRRLR